MKLYRLMIVDPADGGPAVGTKRSMLGIRPTDPANTNPKRAFDTVAVLDSDIMQPGGLEGLSSFDTPSVMHVRINEGIWEIDTDVLPAALEPAQDPKDNTHWMLGPAFEISLGEFQHWLAATRSLWIRIV